MVWAYMGPPDLIPHEPRLDFFEMPDVKFIPFALPYEGSASRTANRE